MDAQSWEDLTRTGASVYVKTQPVRSTVHVLKGAGALEFSVTTAGAQEVVVGAFGSAIGALTPGTKVTFNLWVPAGHMFSQVQAYMQTSVAASWASDFRGVGSLLTNAWNTFTVTVPSTPAYTTGSPLEFGFYMPVSGAWTGKVWVDSITFE